VEIFEFAFMQRALVAGLLVGLACSILGVFLVLRRDAMIGHGLAHVTFGGVALGLLLSISPIWSALVVAVAAALLLLKLKERAGLHGDTAIGIVSSAGFAMGLIIASLSGSFSVELFSYLFGNILAIGQAEVWTSGILALVVMAAVIFNYNDLVAATFDHDLARAAGIPVKRLDALIAILSAVTVVLAMKVVGLLLVTALIVIPSAAGLQLAANFRSAIIFSAGFALVAVSGGLLSAYHLDLPAAGAIVVILTALFLLSWFISKSFKLRH
jgi:zinc transport system permease protein